MTTLRWLCLFLLSTAFLIGEERQNTDEEHLCKWPKEWRQKALIRLDAMIQKAIPMSARTFALEKPPAQETFVKEHPQFETFAAQHGYFSCYQPLVGVVTEAKEDIFTIEKAMASLLSTGDIAFIELAVGEVLTKALAYRNLTQGCHIQLPIRKNGVMILAKYYVDEVLNLWMEMPAFGLIPEEKEIPALLLFRGTDFSFLSKRGWASILSDLDVTGVGFSVFQAKRDLIRNWLGKANTITNSKALVMGFSLGGILSLYTALFEGDLLADTGSVAFNSPGVPDDLFQKWQALDKKKLTLYVTQGDLVSKLGKVPFPTFALSGKETLGPIEAHTKLMTADEPFTLSRVSCDEENAHRFTMK